MALDDHPARWVVGVDGSDDSLVALRWAIARAVASHHAGRPVTIRAVSAWSVPTIAPMGMAGTSTLIEWGDVGDAVGERLTSALESIDRRGIDVEPVVRQGSSTRVLLTEAAESELLVVGRRGLSGLKEMVLGSVSRQCATHAAVPTAVVPTGAPLGDLGRVVVGFDGSDHGAAAVQWTMAAADRLAGESVDEVHIDVVGAFEISPTTVPEMTRARFPDEVAEAERQFVDKLEELDPTHRMTRQFSLLSARRALAEVANGADLVVVGTRGRGAVGAALMGSVSTWMLHNTPCALVVVPH